MLLWAATTHISTMACTSDDCASDRCLQEVVYTPNFDEIFSINKSTTSQPSSAPQTSTNTSSLTAQQQQQSISSSDTFRPLTNVAELIRPAPPPINTSTTTNTNSPAMSPSAPSTPCNFPSTPMHRTQPSPHTYNPQQQQQQQQTQHIQQQQPHQQQHVLLIPTRQQQPQVHQQQQFQQQQRNLPIVLQHQALQTLLNTSAPPIATPNTNPTCSLSSQPRFDPLTRLVNSHANPQLHPPLPLQPVIRPINTIPQQQHQQQHQPQQQLPTFQNTQQTLSVLRANLMDFTHQSYNYTNVQPLNHQNPPQQSFNNQEQTNIYRIPPRQQTPNFIDKRNLSTQPFPTQQTDLLQTQQFHSANTQNQNEQSVAQYQQINSQMPQSSYSNQQISTQTSSANFTPAAQQFSQNIINQNSILNNQLNTSIRPQRQPAKRGRPPGPCTNTGSRIIRDYSRQPQINNPPPPLPNQTNLYQNSGYTNTQDTNTASNINLNSTNLTQQGTLLSDPPQCYACSPETVPQQHRTAQPPVSVSSTTQPPSVPSVQTIAIQATPETFNRACQVDPRPTSLVSKSVNATVSVEDKTCQTDNDDFVFMPKRTYVDRACSPIKFPDTPEPTPEKSNVESSPTKTIVLNNVIRKKHTVKRKKVQLESDSDTEIDVIE